MHRCLQLAALGLGTVAPNPMAGAVLVYNDTIIGEGYHQQYGMAHAEVNCINSVKKIHTHLIEKSTLYVSLEPCAHFGKTPPCVQLIIEKKVPHVVIACVDKFAAVNGKGIQQLKDAGIKVDVCVLENEAIELNKRFFTFHSKQRPYIILKWAASNDGKIAKKNFTSVPITNSITNILVHQWRSQEAAIAVGTNTALHDNPLLTTRLYQGKNPIRIVLDTTLKLPLSLHLFDKSTLTIVFNLHKNEKINNLHFYKLESINDIPQQIVIALFGLNIQSIIIEGGATFLQSFIDAKLWDEARVITNTALIIGDGINEPIFENKKIFFTQQIESDTINYYHPIL